MTAQAGALRALVFRAAAPGTLRQGKVWLAVVAIALGMTLASAVFLINGAAVEEFTRSVRLAAGSADLVVAGSAAGFDEALYPKLAKLPAVALASPVVELNLSLGSKLPALQVWGLDPIQAAQIHPDFFPRGDQVFADLFAPGTVLLSRPAAQRMGLGVGDVLHAEVALRSLALKVVGVLPHEATAEALAVMDIANAQWQLGRLGRLNRIELRLRAGSNLAALQRDIAPMLPAGVYTRTPESSATQSANLSRAYRTNLMILALVALLTGVYLVFTTQALQVLKRRPQLALLRALGASRRRLFAIVVGEGALMGAVGSLVGVAAGFVLARVVLLEVGGNLGAGYFSSVPIELTADPLTLTGFVFAGIAVAMAGAAAPAWEAAHIAPAQALRSGTQETALRRLGRPKLGAALLVLGTAAASTPPFQGLPVGGYASIAFLLAGFTMILPALCRYLLSRLPRTNRPAADLGLLHLRNTPGHVAVSLSALFVSFTVMVAMAIMVYSFRRSVDDWLHQVLAADVYLRAAEAGDSTAFDADAQRKIRALPGAAEVDFVRAQPLLLDPGQPHVWLLARSTDIVMRHRALPLIGSVYAPRKGDPPPIWIAEAVRERYGFHVGQRVRLPLAGRQADFTVAGVWRDYARQFGAIVMQREVYQSLTGDDSANDAAIYLSTGTLPREFIARVRAALPQAKQLQASEPPSIRAVSLRIFDRSFYVTHALEAVAILIGLFGVSASFGAQTLTRKSEFGALRHLGMTRRDIRAMLGFEGALVGVLGVAIGAAAGWAISLVLIHVVNRQSFHWSMDLHVPWLLLAVLAAALVIAAAAAAIASARLATAQAPLRAVREDW